MSLCTQWLPSATPWPLQGERMTLLLRRVDAIPAARLTFDQLWEMRPLWDSMREVRHLSGAFLPPLSCCASGRCASCGESMPGVRRLPGVLPCHPWFLPAASGPF